MADIIGGSQQIQGATPTGVADAGNSVKTGGRAQTGALDAVADDQMVDAAYDLNGRLQVASSPLIATGALTGTGQTVEIDLADTGHSRIAVQIAGTFVGTVVFEATLDDTNYQSVAGTNEPLGDPDILETVPSLWRFDVGGYLKFRIRCSVFTSGTIDVDMRSTLNGAAAGISKVLVDGVVPHDSPDFGNPMKGGAQAINHGTDPAEVDSTDLTDLYADRQGMPFGMLGHPNIITREYMTTAIQTVDAIVDSIGAAQRVIVVACTAVLSQATTATSVKVRIGFGATAPPTEPTSGNSVVGMILVHPGMAAASGVVEGMGGARVAVGGLGEEVRIANDVPTSGQLSVLIRYYVIDE